MEEHEKYENETLFDAEEIQICKPFSAVNNRIEYFLKRKREESNDRNTRVYCNPFSNNYSGSSRTSSTIYNKRQKTSECYIKTTKTYNNVGPYYIGVDSASESNCILSNNTKSDGLKLDLYERVSNIETCLNIKSNDNDNLTIYEKLKSIEDRVLTLQNHWLNNLSKNQYNINSTQETTDITKKNINNKHKELTSEVLSKKSKYTAEDIRQLIRNIQNK